MELTFTDIFNYAGQQTLTGALAFTKNTTGAIAGAHTLVRVMATGAGSIDTSDFTTVPNSGVFVNESGVLNVLLFSYDGTTYKVNIWQAQNVLPDDIVAPTIVDALTLDEHVIAIYLDEAVTGTTGWTFRQNGVTITSTGVTGTNTLQFTFAETFLHTDTLEYSYTPGNTQDAAGNPLASSGGFQSVANNIPNPASYLTWPYLVNAATANNGIEKSAGFQYVWDSFARSNQQISAGEYFQWKEAGPTNQQKYIGFGTDPSPDAYGEIAYGVFFNDNSNVSEISGTSVPSPFTTYATGQWWRLKHTGTSMEIYRSTNGVDFTLLRTVTGLSGSYYVVASMSTTNAEFTKTLKG